jgi:hypothetical protein
MARLASESASVEGHRKKIRKSASALSNGRTNVSGKNGGAERSGRTAGGVGYLACGQSITREADAAGWIGAE